MTARNCSDCIQLGAHHWIQKIKQTLLNILCWNDEQLAKLVEVAAKLVEVATQLEHESSRMTSLSRKISHNVRLELRKTVCNWKSHFVTKSKFS